MTLKRKTRQRYSNYARSGACDRKRVYADNGYSLNELSHVCEVLTSGIIGNENDIGIIKIRDFLISNKFGGGRDFADETYFQMQRALKNHEKNIITKQLGKKREEYYKVPIDIMPEKYWE